MFCKVLRIKLDDEALDQIAKLVSNPGKLKFRSWIRNVKNWIWNFLDLIIRQFCGKGKILTHFFISEVGI